MPRPAAALALVLAALLAPPAPAQDSGAGRFEELGRELDDSLRDLDDSLRGLMDRLGPGLAELLGRLEDLGGYERPEVLPNGDILIRRKRPLPETAPAPAPERRPGTVEVPGTET